MTTIAERLQAALLFVRWEPTDLWVEAAAIGGHLRRRDITDITSGRRQPSRAEYGFLAAAVNERFAELGALRPMPAWDSLA